MPRIYDIYMENLSSLKILTIFMALVGGGVMALYGEFTDLDTNLTYLISIFNKWTWMGLFTAFAISRGINVWRSCNWYISLTTSILGIWLWSLVLVSATLINQMDGDDLMLVIPLIAELWIMARTVEKGKTP